MNHVYLSPHFPPNYHNFCAHLRRLGVNVLGIADEPYDALLPELRDSLTEYYRVDDMHSYDQLLRGAATSPTTMAKSTVSIRTPSTGWSRRPGCAPISTSKARR